MPHPAAPVPTAARAQRFPFSFCLRLSPAFPLNWGVSSPTQSLSSSNPPGSFNKGGPWGHHFLELLRPSYALSSPHWSGCCMGSPPPSSISHPLPSPLAELTLFHTGGSRGPRVSILQPNVGHRNPENPWDLARVSHPHRDSGLELANPGFPVCWLRVCWRGSRGLTRK